MREPMKDIDFKNLSVDELLTMQNKLKEQLTKSLDSKRKEALSQIQELVTKYDLSFDEVVKAIRVTAKRGKAPALYRNPDKPRQTWSGKGDAPDWYSKAPNKEALKISGI